MIDKHHDESIQILGLQIDKLNKELREDRARYHQLKMQLQLSTDFHQSTAEPMLVDTSDSPTEEEITSLKEIVVSDDESVLRQIKLFEKIIKTKVHEVLNLLSKISTSYDHITTEEHYVKFIFGTEDIALKPDPENHTQDLTSHIRKNLV
jgi:hypothetical protein